MWRRATARWTSAARSRRCCARLLVRVGKIANRENTNRVRFPDGLRRFEIVAVVRDVFGVEYEWISEDVDWIRNEPKEIGLSGFLRGAVLDALDDVDRSDPALITGSLHPRIFPSINKI